MFNRDSIGTYQARNDLYQVHNSPSQGKKSSSHLLATKDSMEQTHLNKQIFSKKISMPALFSTPKERVVEVGRAGQTVFYAVVSVPFFVFVKAPVFAFQWMLPLFLKTAQLSFKIFDYLNQKVQEAIQAIALKPLQVLAKQFRKINRKLASLFEKLQKHLGQGSHFLHEFFSKYFKKSLKSFSYARSLAGFSSWLLRFLQKIKGVFTYFGRFLQKATSIISFAKTTFFLQTQKFFVNSALFFKKNGGLYKKWICQKWVFFRKSGGALWFSFQKNASNTFLRIRTLFKGFALFLESFAKRLSKAIFSLYVPLIILGKSFMQKMRGKVAVAFAWVFERFKKWDFLQKKGAFFLKKFLALFPSFAGLSFLSLPGKKVQSFLKDLFKRVSAFFFFAVPSFRGLIVNLLKSSAFRAFLASFHILFLTLLAPLGILAAIVHYSIRYLLIGLLGAFKQLSHELLLIKNEKK